MDDDSFQFRILYILGLCGLLVYINFQENSLSHRARRETAANQLEEHPILEPAVHENHEGLHDVLNMEEDDWFALQKSIGLTHFEMLPYENYESEHHRSKRATLRRFKFKDLPALHPKMKEAYKYRRQQFREMLEDSDIHFGTLPPVELLTEEQRQHFKIGPHDDDYPDYRGFDKTHPIIQQFLDETHYDEKTVFKDGKSQMIFMYPAAIPLNTDRDKHIYDYQHYFQFTQGFQAAFDHKGNGGLSTVRLSIGIWNAGAQFGPKNTVYRPGKFPWSRISNNYLRPKATMQQPRILNTANSLYPILSRYGGSSSTHGRDCFALWFHHDIASDFAQLSLPEEMGKMHTLNDLCTIIHIFVGFKKDDELVRTYSTMLNPHLQNYVAKDPEFAGFFYCPNFCRSQ